MTSTISGPALRSKGGTLTTAAWAAASARSPLAPLPWSAGPPGLGTCCSTSSSAASAIPTSTRPATSGVPRSFPMVPGHEIVGRVREVGSKVTKFKVGDMAGVGCVVDSCRECATCRSGMEQFCEKGAALTYNSTEMDRRTPTQGGYSTRIVVTEHFVLKIPAGLDPAGAAPCCAPGITTYSPLRQWKTKKGDRVGVVGLGGLGSHGESSSRPRWGPRSRCSAPRRPRRPTPAGSARTASRSRRTRSTFKKLAGHFDLIVDTGLRSPRPERLSGPPAHRGHHGHRGRAHRACCRIRVLALCGATRSSPDPRSGAWRRRRRCSTTAAQKKIVSDVEVIPIQKVNEAFERTIKADVRYRFVIDIASLKEGLRPIYSFRRPEDLLELGGRRDLELVVAAVSGLLVSAPAQEDRGVAETVALQVVVLHLADPLHAQGLPREVLARAPPALSPGHALGAVSHLRPVLPGMGGERVLAEGVELLDETPPLRHREGRGHAHVVERARVVVEAEEERAEERPRARACASGSPRRRSPRSARA